MGSEGNAAGKDGLFDVDKRGVMGRQNAEKAAETPGLSGPLVVMTALVSA